MTTIIISDINPEPWTAPSVAIGRKKGGGLYPQVYSSAALKAYQSAIRESLTKAPVEHDVVLRFYFWRQLPAYDTERARRARKHEADATNLQKALEDALQGYMFKNDRQVQDVRSIIMEQAHGTRPMIVIQMEPWTGPPLHSFVLPDEKEVTVPDRRDFDPKDLF